MVASGSSSPRRSARLTVRRQADNDAGPTDLDSSNDLVSSSEVHPVALSNIADENPDSPQDMDETKTPPQRDPVVAGEEVPGPALAGLTAEDFFRGIAQLVNASTQVQQPEPERPTPPLTYSQCRKRLSQCPIVIVIRVYSTMSCHNAHSTLYRQVK